MKKFFSYAGREIPAVTTEQMREIDRIALKETGHNLYQMMENAGRSLAEITMGVLNDHWRTANVIILAGTGGNGGGGICAGRHLANRNANVKLCLANPDRLSEIAAFQRNAYQSASGTEITTEQLANEKPDFIIDALIGYGLNGAPQGKISELIQWANNSGAEILSLDIPSGVDATTGDTLGEFIKATGTLLLALPKTGISEQNSGRLFIADLGIPSTIYEKLGLDYKDTFDKRFFTALHIKDE